VFMYLYVYISIHYNYPTPYPADGINNTAKNSITFRHVAT